MEYFPTLTNKRCKKKTTPLVAHFHNLTIYSVDKGNSQKIPESIVLKPLTRWA